MKRIRRSPAGRPPAGIGGAAVQGYRRATVYLPPETEAQLAAMRAITGQPMWRVVHDAVGALVAGLPPEDRRAVEALVRRAVAAERAA